MDHVHVMSEIFRFNNNSCARVAKGSLRNWPILLIGFFCFGALSWLVLLKVRPLYPYGNRGSAMVGLGLMPFGNSLGF